MLAIVGEYHGTVLMKDLTKRQKAILDWIADFMRENGMPPTVREIGREFGISSAGVFGHLRALERKGHLRRGKLGARSLELTRMPAGDAAQIPLIGRIAAGLPVFTIENFEGTLTVDRRLLRGGGTFFALRVRGESMIEAGILDGDVAIVRRQPTAQNSEIVVALIDNEVTLKRFYREGGPIRLEPANARMKPIYPRDLQIQGVVKGLVRELG